MATPPAEIYTLSLHDALPISLPEELDTDRRTRDRLERVGAVVSRPVLVGSGYTSELARTGLETTADRKSTRLNSSHITISYAVFCLKKKNNKNRRTKCSIDST